MNECFAWMPIHFNRHSTEIRKKLWNISWCSLRDWHLISGQLCKITVQNQLTMIYFSCEAFHKKWMWLGTKARGYSTGQTEWSVRETECVNNEEEQWFERSMNSPVLSQLKYQQTPSCHRYLSHLIKDHSLEVTRPRTPTLSRTPCPFQSHLSHRKQVLST